MTSAVKKIIISIIAGSAFNLAGYADTGFFFNIQFTDKNNTPFSLAEPEEYLSRRAVERRHFFGIAVDSTDLPVNPAYISVVENTGVKVVGKSRWLNNITVLTKDSAVIQDIGNLTFVSKVKYTGRRTIQQYINKSLKSAVEDTNSGAADTQMKQIKADFLHSIGCRAGGIHVAVIDGGFLRADANPAFDSLRLQHRLLGTADFTASDQNVYANEKHGSNVLSILAGNIPGQYLGISPDASFWLLKSEYSSNEFPVEIDFWVSAIEFADSAGVDIATSSVGYNTFNDTAFNFTYSDMNGRVSRASIAAGMAVKKGIIVCISAGNDGAKTWKHIGSPADAEGVVTVGSVLANGTPSSFSSFGPSADGRIKPELCAMGSGVAIVDTGGMVSYASGTSYATPVLAGALACFLQYARENFTAFSPDQLLSAVFESGNSRLAPEAQTGYGIPDFQLAVSNLNTSLTGGDTKHIFYNSENRTIIINSNFTGNDSITLYSSLGKIIFNKKITSDNISLKPYNLPADVYILQIGDFKEKIVVY